MVIILSQFYLQCTRLLKMLTLLMRGQESHDFIFHSHFILFSSHTGNLSAHGIIAEKFFISQSSWNEMIVKKPN